MTDSQAPNIRHAAPADASTLAELGARTFRDTFAADNDPADMEAYITSAFGPEQQGAELADRTRTFFIAEINGDCVGYAQLHVATWPREITGESPVELARLYVSKEWFGHGVGEALMRACVEDARRAGHATMWLGVWERNHRAQAFYRKWDFRVVGQHVFQLGSDPQVDLLMERAL